MTGLTFRSTEVCLMSGVTYRQLDYWDRVGIVSPSASPGIGSGTSRRFTVDDLLSVFVIKQLLDIGITLTRARAVITGLRHVDEFEPRYVIISEEGGVSVAADPLSLAEDIDSAAGATAVVVCLDAVRQVLDLAVASLRLRRAVSVAGVG